MNCVYEPIQIGLEITKKSITKKNKTIDFKMLPMVEMMLLLLLLTAKSINRNINRNTNADVHRNIDVWSDMGGLLPFPFF